MNTKLFITFCFCVAQTWGQSPACGTKGILAFGVGDADKIEVVNRHNYYRSQIANGNIKNQPKASNMKKMVWDDAIAAQAQTLVNTCKFDHIKYTDPRWGPVGQNLFKSMTSSNNSKANWTQAVDSWFNEVNYYTYPNITLAGKMSGHYTQVVWATTYAVGCGYAQYYDDNTKFYNNFIACNYGPAGNWRGVPPYLTGPGCENLC